MLDSVALGRLGLRRSQVALLRESSTQYGQSLTTGRARQDRGDRECRSPLPPSSSPWQNPDTSAMVVISFPMSISSLRSEYQRVPVSRSDEATLPGGQEGPRLPLDLLDPTRPKEDLPVTSRLSPPALDLILDEVARTLVRRQIRLVGLLATDVRDKLFLGDEIRKRVRDVQFFTYESNVLYLRSDRNFALRGMLVFSTYPLLLQNQRGGTGKEIELRTFASDGAEGVYNATLRQLERTELLLDYRTRLPSGSFVLRPPVWLTTVGNGTFLPVSMMPVTGQDSGYVFTCRGNCPQSSRTPYPGLAFLPLAALLLASFALSAVALDSLLGDRQLYQRLAGETLNGHVETLAEGSLALHERLYSVLRLIAVGGVFLAASTPVFRIVATLRIRNPLLLVAGVASAFLAIWAVTTGVGSIIRMLLRYRAAAREFASRRRGLDWTVRWNDRLEFAARVAVGVFGVIYLALSVRFTADIGGLAADRAMEFWRFVQRASEIDSLVSPLLPLMLGGLGYGIWCTWHLHRVALLRSRTTFEEACDREALATDTVRLTLNTALRDDLNRAARTMGQIRARLFQVIPTPWALAFLLGFGCLCTWLWPLFGRSLESLALAPWILGLTSFDLLFRLTVPAMLFATAWGAYRLLAVWSGLREVLEIFARMPLIPAFERLPVRLGQLTRLTLPVLGSRTSAGIVADLQWLHLQRIYQARRVEIDEALAPYRQSVSRHMGLLMEGNPVQHLRLGVTGRQALVDRFLLLHGVLRELWRLEPMPGDLTALEGALTKEFEKPDAAGGNTVSTTSRIRRGFAGPVRLWLRAAEEYAAIRMVEYTEWVVRQLRLLAGFLVLSLLIATLVIASYPYHPQGLLRALLLLVLLGAVGTLLLVLVQMNRDEVLSRIARTDPGRLTWDFNFVIHLVAFGAVPLLTLLSSEFPTLRGLLFAWVEPLIRMLVRQ